MSILDILFLAALLWIIQFYIQPSTVKNISFLPSLLAKKNSVSFIAVFFFLFGIKNIIGFFVSKAQFNFLSEVAIRISRKSLLNYQQEEFEQFVNTDSSVYIRKIAFQSFEFCQYILSGIQQIITQTFLISVTIIAILLFNAKLFLFLLLALLPPVVIVFYIIKKRLTATKKNIRTYNERSFQYLMDALKGYVESNIYDRNEFFMERFINFRKKFSQALFESLSVQTLPSRAIEVFAVMGLFVLIVIANWSGSGNTSMLITIGAFMAAAYKIIPGIVKIINASGQIRAYEFSVSDLHSNSSDQTIEEINRSSTGINSLQMKKIHFSYPGQTVLNGFDLSIKKREFVAITGKSGRGKTTILNLSLGFIKPSSGEICINNEIVERKALKSFWPSISYVRQQPFFIHDTIAKNITLEEKTSDPKNLNYVIHISGLNELIAASPEGLDKMITENGKNISGGQQQRIAIARALYKKADLILLDEPFNELDDSSCIALLTHFKQLALQGKMIILITHDKMSLDHCDKIISLDE